MCHEGYFPTLQYRFAHASVASEIVSRGPAFVERMNLVTLALALAAANPGEGSQLMYTTYFYTAAEAVVHGYEADTHIRVVSLADKGTVYQGVIGAGEAKLIPTGAG